MIDRPADALDFVSDSDSMARARHWVAERVAALAPHLVDDATLVMSELATNAVLHASGPYMVRVLPSGPGVRLEVVDRRPERLPVTSGTGLAEAFALDFDDPDLDDLLEVETMTGRGLVLVVSLSDGWGVTVDETAQTKTVWAEIGSGVTGNDEAPAAGDVAAGAGGAATAGNVELLAVPARLVLTSAANLDDVIREFRFAPDQPGELGELAANLLGMSSGAREPVRVAARAAIEQGSRLVHVRVQADAKTVEVLQRFVDVVERLAVHCTRGSLLSLAPTAEVAQFRRWYVDEITRQVAGAPPKAAPFSASDRRDPAVVAAVASADATFPEPGTEFDPASVRQAQRSIAASATFADVATATLRAAGDLLGAATGSFCIADLDARTVTIQHALGYPRDVTSHWGTFDLFDDLPASEVIRTGEAMFFRTAEEYLSRFPIFATTPRVGSAAMAVVPISSFGALVTGYREQRAFTARDRSILEALAGAAADRCHQLLATEGRQAGG